MQNSPLSPGGQLRGKNVVPEKKFRKGWNFFSVAALFPHDIATGCRRDE